MKFSIYQESRKGTRSNNQDRTGYVYSRDALLMVVADGMGGHLHGEVASQIAVQVLTEAFQREVQDKLVDPFIFLLKNISNAHHAIIDYAEARDLLETPRTTCVACVVQEATAYWVHVGDSRLYHVRDGRIVAQTKDHSRVQLLLDQGRIDEEAAAAHPDRNKIFNCLGAMTPPHVDLSRRTLLRAGDTLLLCTDGLWGPLTGHMIVETLAKDDIMHSIPVLLDTAEQRAARECDNLSAVAMTWTDSHSEAAHETSTLTLEPSGFTTKTQEFGTKGNELTYLTDEEIEQAVAEIRNAIRKHTAK